MDRIRRPDMKRRNSFSLALDTFAGTTASTSRSEISVKIIRDKEMRIEIEVGSQRGDKTEQR